jgi:hypothetical protein
MIRDPPMRICDRDRGSPNHDFLDIFPSAEESESRTNASMLPILIRAILCGENTDSTPWQHLSNSVPGLSYSSSPKFPTEHLFSRRFSCFHVADSVLQYSKRYIICCGEDRFILQPSKHSLSSAPLKSICRHIVKSPERFFLHFNLHQLCRA